MNDEFDCDLTLDQWEALKALRRQDTSGRPRARFVLENLAALGLVAIDGDLAVMTARGRQVLIRGSLRLLDVAA